MKSSLKKEQKSAQSHKDKKLLVVAHNHPHLFPGGAEIIAYDLFRHLDEHSRYETFFMASVSASHRKLLSGTPFQKMRDASNEILFWGEDFDHFFQSQKNLPSLYNDFRSFLEEHKPNIIHFHHTLRIGLEALQVARTTLPNCKIVYTLHEFILMCHHQGQMVRPITHELCEGPAPARCHQCFPDISLGQFRMRESFIQSHLALVDQFIAPSRFLAERFMQWGIPLHKMAVIENGRASVACAPGRVVGKNSSRNVFGFFGQINPYKGVLLLLEAAKLLKAAKADFRIILYGNIELQEEDFKRAFDAALKPVKTHVEFRGRYQAADLPALMQTLDWVVVPSTWWENSPLVIQEAFQHKRPVICSNIGGMAEKVAHNSTGLHFKVGDAQNLADTLLQATKTPGLWEKLVGNITGCPSLEACSKQHVALYDTLLSGVKS